MNDLKAVIKQAERAGLLYERGKRHPKIRDPRSGRAITLSATPSCPHAHKRVLRDLRVYLGITLDP